MVDIDLGLQLFSEDRQIAMRLFIDYMQQQNQDLCLDDYVKFRMPDSEVREHLTKMGITNSSFLQSLDKEERDHVLIMLKELKGVNIRQLSRITGISKSVIQRARL
jgi:putative transposase